MKLSFRGWCGLTRGGKVAIVSAALVAVGAILLDRGWYTAGALALVGGGGTVALYFAAVVRPARLKRDSILTLRVTDGLREDVPRSPLDRLRSRGTPSLCDIRRALEGAAADPLLKAVVIEIAAPGLGLATAQELHDLLRMIGSTGKRVIAVLHGDNVTVRDYFAAAGAGEIVVNPDTGMLMLGVAAGGMFLRQALENFGVEAQTLQWKEYKGAGETFARQTMSPALRESLEAIIGDWKTVLVNAVAEARGRSPEWATAQLEAGFLSAAGAVERGLVDRTGYIEEIREELAGKDWEEQFLGLGRYLRHLAYQQDGRAAARIALIHGLGPIVTGDAPPAGEFISGERLAEQIQRAAADNEVRAIVFRVNSPGGSAVGSDLVWRAVREARKRGKPVVVSMGDVAGSGGYYVAMGADAIVAEPTTVTGSVGVVFTKFSLAALLARAGIVLESAKSSPLSDALSLSRTLTEGELTQMNEMIGQLYTNFVAKFAEDRKLDYDAAEAVARGRVWSGLAAKARGLVDELGGLQRAVAIAREKAGLKAEEPHELSPYPEPGLIGSLKLSMARNETPPVLGLIATALDLPQRWAPGLLQLLMRSRVQALQLWGW